MRYEDFITSIYNSNEDDWLYDDEVGKWVFKNDIRISILSDRSEQVGGDDFHEDWARRFPDPNAKRKLYNFQFNDCFIERFYAVSVDGYRSSIPYPKLPDMTITREQYAVGRIINSIHGHSFDEYLQVAAITVV